MNEKMIQEVLKRVDSIGIQMKEGGIKLGEEAIKWTLFYNVGVLIVQIIFFVFSFAAMKFVWKCLLVKIKEEDGKRYPDPIGYWMLAVGSTAICLIILLNSLFCCIPDTIANIYSPAWAVVRSFLPQTVQ